MQLLDHQPACGVLDRVLDLRRVSASVAGRVSVTHSRRVSVSVTIMVIVSVVDLRRMSGSGERGRAERRTGVEPA